MLSGIGAGAHHISESVGAAVHHNSVSSRLTWVDVVHEMESVTVGVFSGVVRKMDDGVTGKSSR